MKGLLRLLLISILFVACHNGERNTPLVNEEPSTFNGFCQLFRPLKFPFKLNQDSLGNNRRDTQQISALVISRFLPDTLTKGFYPKGEHLKIYPYGIIKDSKLNSIFLKIKSNEGVSVFLCLFNKNGLMLNRLLIGRLPLVASQSLVTSRIDKKFTITIHREKKLESKIFTKEDVYVAFPDGHVMLIMTNANFPTNTDEIFNPIDTLPAKHKFSGNYTGGKLNILSIRDARNPREFRFFIHFSKENGKCIGEIDGTGRFTSHYAGIFHEKVGPCAIGFHFTSNSVTFRELGGCGSYRGIECFFDGTFHKVKVIKKRKKRLHHSI
ncbi:MAG: hypothetical protein ACYCOO_10070 [Chitinophagaceae bacterium]